MPLLDHFHPPLHGPRRWEGFLGSWATMIARQLNLGLLPKACFAEPSHRSWPEIGLEDCEIRVCQQESGTSLSGVIKLVSPVNKDRPDMRQTFLAKCAENLKRKVGLIMLDVVTSHNDNLYDEFFDLLEAKELESAWRSTTGLYVISFRALTAGRNPRVDVWAQELALAKELPIMPLWLSADLCVPVNLEESYIATCESLRIPAA